jgi:hypothetical protein
MWLTNVALVDICQFLATGALQRMLKVCGPDRLRTDAQVDDIDAPTLAPGVNGFVALHPERFAHFRESQNLQ